MVVQRTEKEHKTRLYGIENYTKIAGVCEENLKEWPIQNI